MKKIAIALTAIFALTGSALAQSSSGNYASERSPNFLERLLGVDRVTTSSVNRPQRNTNRARNGGFNRTYRGNGLSGNYSGNVLERDVYTGR